MLRFDLAVLQLKELLLCPLCSKLFTDTCTVSECGHNFCNACIYDKLGHERRCPTCHLPAIVKNLKKNPSHDTLVGCLTGIMRLSTTRETKPGGATGPPDVSKTNASLVEDDVDVFLTTRSRQGDEMVGWGESIFDGGGEPPESKNQDGVEGILNVDSQGGRKDAAQVEQRNIANMNEEQNHAKENTTQDHVPLYTTHQVGRAYTPKRKVSIKPEAAATSKTENVAPTTNSSATALQRSRRRKSVANDIENQPNLGDPLSTTDWQQRQRKRGSRSLVLADVSNKIKVEYEPDKQLSITKKPDPGFMTPTPAAKTRHKMTGAKSADAVVSRIPAANDETPSRPATAPRTRKRKALTETPLPLVQTDLTKRLAEQWICAKCTFANFATRRVCQMCKESKRNSLAKTEVKLEATEEGGGQQGKRTKRARRGRDESTERRLRTRSQSVEVKMEAEAEAIVAVDDAPGTNVVSKGALPLDIVVKNEVDGDQDEHEEDQVVAASQSEEIDEDYGSDETQLGIDMKTPSRPLPMPVSGIGSSSSSSMLAPKTIHLVYTGLKDHHKKILEDCMTRIVETNLTIRIYDTNVMEDDASHVITAVDADGLCARTLKYLCAVLSGKWIVRYEWVVDSVKAKRWLDEQLYEVHGDQVYGLSGAPKKGRDMASRNQGRLFENYKFYFHGDFSPPTPSKPDLQRLIQFAGGKLLTRRPPKTLALTTTPERVRAAMEIDRTKPIIVCDPTSKMEVKVNAWLRDFQTRDTSWLLNCVSEVEVL